MNLALIITIIMYFGLNILMLLLTITLEGTTWKKYPTKEKVIGILFTGILVTYYSIITAFKEIWKWSKGNGIDCDSFRNRE